MLIFFRHKNDQILYLNVIMNKVLKLNKLDRDPVMSTPFHTRILIAVIMQYALMWNCRPNMDCHLLCIS